MVQKYDRNLQGRPIEENRMFCRVHVELNFFVWVGHRPFLPRRPYFGNWQVTTQ